MLRHKRVCRRAFTLIELGLVIVVLAILTVIALPDQRAEEQTRLDSALDIIQGDIEYARSVAIGNPGKVMTIQVNPTANAYWLAYADSPTTAITNPMTGAPYRIQFGSQSDVRFKDLILNAGSLGSDSALVFDSTGGLNSSAAETIQIQSARFVGNVTVSANSAVTTTSSYENTGAITSGTSGGSGS